MKAFLILYLTVNVWANHTVPYEVDISKDGFPLPGNMETNINSSNLTLINYILDGGLAAEGQFPWIVSLFWSANFNCGGSIVNGKTILTAAHCVIGAQPSDLNIKVGSVSLKTGGSKVNVSQIKIHESYDNNKNDNDIALLITTTELPIDNKTVKPVQLAKQEPIPGTVVTVAGWGGINQDATIYPDSLHYTNTSIISRSKCKEFIFGDNFPISDHVLCAYIEGSKKSFCYGDSGGPLTQNNIQVGIVSYGGECVWPNHPGVYINVANFIQWINSNKV